MIAPVAIANEFDAVASTALVDNTPPCTATNTGDNNNHAVRNAVTARIVVPIAAPRPRMIVPACTITANKVGKACAKLFTASNNKPKNCNNGRNAAATCSPISINASWILLICSPNDAASPLATLAKASSAAPALLLTLSIASAKKPAFSPESDITACTASVRPSSLVISLKLPPVACCNDSIAKLKPSDLIAASADSKPRLLNTVVSSSVGFDIATNAALIRVIATLVGVPCFVKPISAAETSSNPTFSDSAVDAAWNIKVEISPMVVLPFFMVANITSATCSASE